MNKELSNSISGYIRTLYRMNQQCILLCGVDLYNDSDDYIVWTLDLIRDISRVVPYSYNRKEKKLHIDEKNGLIEFAEELPYLISDYEDILSTNYKFLDNVRKVRNKYEHRMHDAKWSSSGSGSNRYLCVTFEVTNYSGEKEDVDISITQCVQLLKKLNVLFNKIITEVKEYAEENNKIDYPFYRRLCKSSFLDFNTIYDSQITKTVGRIFDPVF